MLEYTPSYSVAKKLCELIFPHVCGHDQLRGRVAFCAHCIHQLKELKPNELAAAHFVYVIQETDH